MATYYVKNGGDDLKDGLSDANAWATIAKVNASAFNSGDIISFRKSDMWRETLTVPSSGNVGNYIIFNSYGSGDNPQILGSELALAFADQGGNIWKSPTVLADPFAGTDAEIFFKETDGSITWGVHQINPGALAAEYDWTWIANEIYVYATTDPDTRYDSIEVPQREYSIYLDGKEYIEINGIDMFYLKNSGVRETYPTGDLNGFILRNCEIAYLATKNGAGYGSHVMYSNSLYKYNMIHDCGRRGMSLYNYGNDNISNIIVQFNTFYNGYHTTGVDLSAGSIGNTGNVDDVIIRNNLMYDDPNKVAPYSNLIFIKNVSASGSTLTGVYIYNNLFKYPAGSSIHLEDVGESFVYNNTFYGMNQIKTDGTFHLYYTLGSTNAVLKNNIFYGDADYDVNTYGVCVRLGAGQNYADVDADYNLYWQEDNRQMILLKFDVPQGLFHMDDWIAMKVTSGWETNSPTPANPIFVNAPDDLHLQVSSPAIGAGENVGLTNDYDGNPWRNPPSIGAYEISPIIIGNYINSTLLPAVGKMD